jgi:cytochrome c-type biogenesis protein CcmE
VRHGVGADVRFTVTDGKSAVPVTYHGVLPALFREGQGVVALGALNDTGTFFASEVLAKHDERYMPPEVVDALKRSGRWKEGQ